MTIGKSLSELVNTALSEADAGLKLASARDVAPPSRDVLDEELNYVPRVKAASDGSSFGEEPKKDEKKSDDKDDKKEKRSSVRETAAYALKLASALEKSAGLVSKLASSSGMSPLKAPGPAVMEGGFEGAKGGDPKAQGNQHAFSGGNLTQVSPPSNKNDHTGNLDGEQPPNNTGKTASARLAAAQEAQASVLERVGFAKEAAKLRKVAQDPSSPQPNLPAATGDNRLSTEPGESSHIPDNAGIISMTKAQAKDRSIATATQHISETPKKDNAVAAHALRTDGQKISALGEKIAKKDDGPRRHEYPLRELHESPRAQSILGGVLGGAMGAHLGHSARGGKGALVGGAAGALAGAGAGYVGAHANRGINRLGDHAYDALVGHDKKSSASPELQRAYLARAIKVANDQNADPEERELASKVVAKIQSMTAASDPAALLG